jgi:hypothetical protein
MVEYRPSSCGKTSQSIKQELKSGIVELMRSGRGQVAEVLYIDETWFSIYEGLFDEYDISMQFLDIPIITVQCLLKCLLAFSPYIQSFPVLSCCIYSFTGHLVLKVSPYL